MHHVFDLHLPACLQSWFLLYIIWRLQQQDTPPVIVWWVLCDAGSTLAHWIAGALGCVQTMQLASFASAAAHLVLMLLGIGHDCPWELIHVPV